MQRDETRRHYVYFSYDFLFPVSHSDLSDQGLGLQFKLGRVTRPNSPNDKNADFFLNSLELYNVFTNIVELIIIIF